MRGPNPKIGTLDPDWKAIAEARRRQDWTGRKGRFSEAEIQAEAEFETMTRDQRCGGGRRVVRKRIGGE